MKKPPAPENEEERLRSLRALRLLDTPREERFDRITRLARRSIRVPIALVSLVDGDRQWFKSAQGLASPETHRDISFCGHAIREEEILVVPDTTRDERFIDNPLVTDGPEIRMYAGRPIHAPDGHRIGTLCVIDQVPRSLGPDDLVALDDLAVLVENELRADALGISERELRVQLGEAERRAALDSLTRLWNRDAVLRILASEVERSAQRALALSVLMIDLDDFKQVNDEHGHLVGDQMLLEAAGRMRRALRSSDSLGRYGGEEFVAVLPECDSVNAEAAAERVRIRMNECGFATEAGNLQLTVSVGVFSMDVASDTCVEDLVGAADAALYEAKRAGRNRVVVRTHADH